MPSEDFKSQVAGTGSTAAISEVKGSAGGGSKQGMIAGLWLRLQELLSRPVDGASLTAFRFGLGIVMALEAYSLCHPNVGAISTGDTPLAHYYTGPDIRFHFPYAPFEWLPVLPAWGMYLLVALQALAGITLAIGLWSRLSAGLVFLCWGYFFAIESTRSYWQSHYYLELLMCFLMIWLPPTGRLSLFGRRSPPDGPRTIPFWPIFLLRGQLVIAYFYAGVAKINLDWLLDAVPVRWFLAEPAVTARYEHLMNPELFARFQALVHSPAFAYFLSYTGLVFDLAVGFLFLARRTRIFALVLMLIFHVTNHFLIFRDIGWFPLVGIATSLIFLEPDWPRRFWRWLWHPRLVRPDWKWFWGGALVFPVVGAALGWKLKPTPASLRADRAASPKARAAARPLSPQVAPLLVAWLVWQTLVPLRHYAIPGDARFTYEGLSFSWRLKSEVHSARAAEFHIHDPIIIPPGARDEHQIQWAQWHGDKTIYQYFEPGTLSWDRLPEFLVILEPLFGERIIYNPYSPSTTVRNEAEARQRIRTVWQALYGRPPQNISRTSRLSQVLKDVSEGLRAGAEAGAADQVALQVAAARRLEQGGLGRDEAAAIRGRIFRVLEALHARDGGGRLTAALRTMDPFALDNQPSSTFLVIEDAALYTGLPGPWPVLDRKLTLVKDATASAAAAATPFGSSPLVVCTSGKLGGAASFLLPKAAIFETVGQTNQSPYIRWNTLKDANFSKLNHISNQAFYLRRYARRVAGLWEQEYHRRPAVTAITGVSLNGRPFQPLVKPDTDLASVPLVWFGHNPWIEDLQMPRVPREALEHQSGWFVGE